MPDVRTRGIPHRRFRALLLAVVGALLVASAPGCAFRSGPAEDRASLSIGALLAPESWPARETELLDDMVRVTPTTLTIAYPVSIIQGGVLSTANWMQKVNVLDTGVYGRGIIREIEPVLDNSANHDVMKREFGGLHFVSFPPDPGAVRVASAARTDDISSRYRRLLLRRLGIRPGRADTWNLTREGTRMQLFEPSGEEPRGVIIHLSSLAGFDYERPVIDRLNKSGWLVLQIEASTARRRERPVDADVDGDIEGAARRLARVIDNRIAEIAYAAEAGLEFVEKNRPEFAHKPVVVAGYSAGALVGPSVATLLHDRIDAVILVGGGANLLNISRRSSLTNGGISIRWSGGPVDENAWRRLEDAYLSQSRLDPHNTAPFLLDKPVLMFHGILDDIIPADTGDLLYRRLGRPERLVFPLGHRGLFWRLPAQAAYITRWLEANAVAPRAENNRVVHAAADAPTATPAPVPSSN